MSARITFIRDMTPCSLVGVYRHFGDSRFHRGIPSIFVTVVLCHSP